MSEAVETTEEDLGIESIIAGFRARLPEEDDTDDTDEPVAELDEDLDDEELDDGSEDDDDDDDVVDAGGTAEEGTDWNEILKDMKDKPDNWQQLIETEEKRRKDSQVAFQKERERVLALERDLAARDAAPPSTAPPETPVASADELMSTYREKFAEDPEDAIAWLVQEQNKAVEQKFQQMEKLRQANDDKAYEAELAKQESESKAAHADYDEVVTDFLVKEMESDPTLVTEWHRKGGTTEAAYNMGVALQAVRNPEAVKERLRNEILAEQKRKKKPIGDTLAGVTSQTRGTRQDRRPTSVLDRVFG